MRLFEAIGRHPRLVVLIGASCIAFSGIFYRFSGASPATGTLLRCLYGLPILALIAWNERRRYGPLPPSTIRLAVLAGAFFAGDLLSWHHAIEWVGAGLATVLGNLQVLIVGFVAWLLFRERPSRRVAFALPIVLVGVTLISGLVGSGAYGRDPLLGVGFGVVTAFMYSGYLLAIRRSGRDLRRIAGPVAIATASTAVVALAFGLLVGDIRIPSTVGEHLWLVGYRITSQSVGYLLISLSLPRLPAVLTSIILLAQPVMTVVLAMILLGEAPSALQLAGVALVVGGIGIATVTIGRPASVPAAARQTTG